MKTGEPFYGEIDDSSQPNADLSLVTDGRTSSCWGGEYPQFIDHIVLSKNASPWVVEGSFAQLVYDAADAAFKEQLSDHCPISVGLKPTGGGGSVPSDPDPDPGTPGTEPTNSPVKGNINSRGRKLYHVPWVPQLRADANRRIEGRAVLQDGGRGCCCGMGEGAGLPVSMRSPVRAMTLPSGAGMESEKYLWSKMAHLRDG